MKLNLFPCLATASTLLLVGCAAPDGYPSLAIRDSERMSGNFQTPPSPIFTPTAPTPATIAELGTLAESAHAAHTRFLAQVAETRVSVIDAVGEESGSLSWSAAQVAIARLESTRADALVALADIDRLYVTAALDGNELLQLEVTRGDISALVDEQNRLLSDLFAALGN